MTDVVKQVPFLGVCICRVSHTAQSENSFFSQGGDAANWTTIAQYGGADGTKLNWRGNWSEGEHYSAAPISGGGSAPDPSETDVVPDELFPALRFGEPDAGAGTGAEALPIGLHFGPAVHGPEAAPAPEPEEETLPIAEAVHTALRNQVVEYGGEPALWPPFSASTREGKVAELFEPQDNGAPLPVGDQAQPAERPSDAITSRYLLLETDNAKEPVFRSWALLTVRELQRAQTDLGGKRFEISGAVIVDVFTSIDSLRGGDGSVKARKTKAIDSVEALAMATEFQRIYDAGQIRFEGGRVLLSGAKMNEVGISGKWYQVRVTAPFKYYQTRG